MILVFPIFMQRPMRMLFLECFMPNARMILIELSKIIFGQREDLPKLKVQLPYIATFVHSCL